MKEKSSGSSDLLYCRLMGVGWKKNTKLSPIFTGCRLWRIVLSLRKIGKPRPSVSLGGKVMSLVLDMLSNKKISK